jgi:hypothetical protein
VTSYQGGGVYTITMLGAGVSRLPLCGRKITSFNWGRVHGTGLLATASCASYVSQPDLVASMLSDLPPSRCLPCRVCAGIPRLGVGRFFRRYNADELQCNEGWDHGPVGRQQPHDDGVCRGSHAGNQHAPDLHDCAVDGTCGGLGHGDGLCHGRHQKAAVKLQGRAERARGRRGRERLNLACRALCVPKP